MCNPSSCNLYFQFPFLNDLDSFFPFISSHALCGALRCVLVQRILFSFLVFYVSIWIAKSSILLHLDNNYDVFLCSGTRNA